MYWIDETGRDDWEKPKIAPKAGRREMNEKSIIQLKETCPAFMAEFKSLHFHDHIIEVRFDHPPALEKTPPCPDGFMWNGQSYRVTARLAEWNDFTRRGKMARNMRPSHAATAAGRGSLGVGRFYFRVRVDSDQIFDLYYDRAPQDADRRKGQWYLYRELTEGD